MTVTVNMNLVLPTPTVTIGPQWAIELNNALTLVDTHDHSPGKGTKVTPAGLDINQSLNINQQDITNTRSAKFTNELSLLSPSETRSVYVSNGDLYYNNNAGVPVQITSGSAVNTSTLGVANSFNYSDLSSSTVILPSSIISYFNVNTTSSAITVQLPLANSVNSGRFYVIKDATGNASVNPITITRSGSDTIEGASTVVLNGQRSFIKIVSNGSNGWTILDRNLGSEYPITASNSNIIITGSGGSMVDILTTPSLPSGRYLISLFMSVSSIVTGFKNNSYYVLPNRDEFAIEYEYTDALNVQIPGINANTGSFFNYIPLNATQILPNTTVPPALTSGVISLNGKTFETKFLQISTPTAVKIRVRQFDTSFASVGLVSLIIQKVG